MEAEKQEQSKAELIKPIGEKQLLEFQGILNRYRDGKRSVDERIINSEQWWKMRNSQQEKLEGGHDRYGFKSRSAWLHSVIKNKHADAMDAFPEPNILPREPDDRAEASKLSKIIPCVLEKNSFEEVYSANMWSKMKFGTGVYKIIWDKNKLGGLGDISISRCNILNLFWEPGIEDIQQSKYFFEVDFQDADELKEAFPQLEGKAIPRDIYTGRYKYDDTVDTSDKIPVISVYYRRRGILHYCLFVPGTLLYATENDSLMSERGFYDHGKYPYVFDALFPVEGSPCGYGYVDLNKSDQTEIDLMKSAMVENAMVGATPRYYTREGTGINKAQFLDLNNRLVEVQGGLSDDYLRPIEYNPLPGNYINILNQTIDQMRETSGNTEVSTGNTGSGVTAASAIAALQEASGKGSRDSALSSYRAYSRLIYLCIELIRQFYDIPRQFRITGETDTDEFVSFSNEGILPKPQYDALGQEAGLRLPVFDIKVVPQRRSAYTKMSNNELALQLYNLGFFDPGMSVQATACLSMMEFDGKDKLLRLISGNGSLYTKLEALAQYASALAQKYGDTEKTAQLAAIMESLGTGKSLKTALVSKSTDGESGKMRSMRSRARAAVLPNEGGAEL